MESLNIFDFQKTNIYDLFMIIIKKAGLVPAVIGYFFYQI